MDTPELMERIWQQAEPSVFISRREFFAGLDGWEIEPKEVDGDIIGATLVCGAEFHFMTFGVRKRFSRALITDCLRPIINRHGFVRTKTPREDMRQRRFNQIIGFRIEREDEYFTHFRMENLRLHGGASCQS